MARANHRRATKRGLLISVVVFGFLAASCAAAPVEEPASCDELRRAWEEAGGPVANYSTQVRTVELVTELGGRGGPPAERVTCATLFDAAYTAATCSAPDTPPAFRSCAEG